MSRTSDNFRGAEATDPGRYPNSQRLTNRWDTLSTNPTRPPVGAYGYQVLQFLPPGAKTSVARFGHARIRITGDGVDNYVSATINDILLVGVRFHVSVEAASEGIQSGIRVIRRYLEVSCERRLDVHLTAAACYAIVPS